MVGSVLLMVRICWLVKRMGKQGEAAGAKCSSVKGYICPQDYLEAQFVFQLIHVVELRVTYRDEATSKQTAILPLISNRRTLISKVR